MHNEHLKLSLFLDNELDKKQTLSLLTQLADDIALDQKYRRYDAVSQAIKSDVFLTVSDDFVSRVSDQLKTEVVYFKPGNQRKRQQLISFTALAASLAVVAVMVVKENALHSAVDQINPLTLAETTTSKKLPKQVSPPSSAKTPKQSDESIQMVAGSRHMNQSYDSMDSRFKPINPKFNDYLQAHSNNLYSSGSDFQAYAQVADYGQE